MSSISRVSKCLLIPSASSSRAEPRSPARRPALIGKALAFRPAGWEALMRPNPSLLLAAGRVTDGGGGRLGKGDGPPPPPGRVGAGRLLSRRMT
jgi:hypothetical protein